MRGYDTSRCDTGEDWSPPVRSSVKRKEAGKDAGESYFGGLVSIFNQENSVDCREPSMFEKTMDYIAFPEKHIGRLDPSQSKVPTVEDVREAFEKAMNCVEYPERHVTYEKVGIDASHLMDVLAFPERHFFVPELVISDEATAKTSSTDGQARKSEKSARSTSEAPKCESLPAERVQIPTVGSGSMATNEVRAILCNERDIDALDFAFSKVESLAGLANNDDLSITDKCSKSTTGNRSTKTLELKPRMVDRTRSLVSDSSVSTTSTSSKAPPAANKEMTTPQKRRVSEWEQTLKNRSITRYVKKDAVSNWVSPVW